ncbi:MAG: PilZ domain-containing protein [Desulfuromonadaceae bacterium]|nr:PilZ domain-containing protein [Desulfuromonadaceae bacterium]MDD2848838.1 PilZ domain-containing protein [Desulfuromonadaceae bacterium]MDD4132205.1 PilZ domain-containing protein [Desulfuromonadaceae bacterium]
MVKTEIPDNNFFCLMDDPEEGSVENDLSKLASSRPHTGVQLLNYYKEVPLSAPARILEVSESGVVCRTSELQARAIEYSEYTIIQGAPFRHHVYANALYDKESGNLALSALQYVEVHSNRRKSVRVRMQVPPLIGLEAGATKFSGRMLDLSLDGCAVNIPDRDLLGNFSFFYLTIAMPLKPQQPPGTTRLLAKLAKVYQHNRLFRCIFLFEHDKSSENQIGMLIARRQTDIIRELSP